KTFAIEVRAAERYDQLPAMAADLVRQRVAVIVAAALPAALAAKTATTAIPIVFNVGDDPVQGRAGGEAQSPWRQSHGRDQPASSPFVEAIWAFARAGAGRRCRWGAVQSGESEYGAEARRPE